MQIFGRCLRCFNQACLFVIGHVILIGGDADSHCVVAGLVPAKTRVAFVRGHVQLFRGLVSRSEGAHHVQRNRELILA
jgi:hypothetical protein